MINWKRLGLKLLYPRLGVIVCLLPVSIVILIFSLIHLKNESFLAIISYVFAFYVLLVICFRIPRMIKCFKNFKQKNKYMQKWFSDVRLRMNVSLCGSLMWNITFAIFQLGLGIYHKSFWFYSMFAYYLMLTIMRFFLLKHIRKYKTGEQEQVELKKYIVSGWLLLFMNFSLAVIVVFMVCLYKTFEHHMITTIAMAAYTFFTFSFAIVNLVKYKKYNSPVYSSAKMISLVAGAVSMLTLESIMLTTFSANESALFGQIMLSITGVSVIGFAIAMAIVMIVNGRKKLVKLLYK